MRVNRLIFLVCFFFIMLMFSGCGKAKVIDLPKVKNGSMDLSNYDICRKTLQLDGSWEFYWNKLLLENDLRSEKPDAYVKVPNTWNKYTINGEVLPGKGCATYRLHVKTNLSANTMLGLRIYNFSSAYNLFINDRLIASNGKVAASASGEIGNYTPQAVMFNTPSKDFDIIIQVSNFHYARGGFWYTLSMGGPGAIVELDNILIGKEILIIGILLILFLFYLTIYLLRRELKYSLYFALMCFLMAFSLDMVGQFLLLRLFPNINFQLTIFIWYTSSTWVVQALLLFLNELFRSKFSALVIKIYMFGCIVSQILYIATPTDFYTKIGLISNMGGGVGVLASIVIVIIGIKKGQRDGWLNIAGLIVLAVTYIHDILYWTNVINNSFGELIYLGLIFYLLIQMIIQAQRIKMIDESRKSAELSMLQAQIKPHFLYNTLNTIISISRYDMDNSRELLRAFSNYLRRSFDFKDLSQFVPLRNEIELAQAYIEIEKARFEERINVNFELPENIDLKVPKLILQPLIENAVIHGILPKRGNGRIDVHIRQNGKVLFFTVKDDGVGIDRESKTREKNGENRSVGLMNINSRLHRLYGKGLQIKSNSETGTEISWFIQLK